MVTAMQSDRNEQMTTHVSTGEMDDHPLTVHGLWSSMPVMPVVYILNQLPDHSHHVGSVLLQ